MRLRRDLKYLQAGTTLDPLHQPHPQEQHPQEPKPNSNSSTLSLNLEDIPRRTRNKVVSYQLLDSETDQEQQPEEEEPAPSFICPQVQAVISMKEDPSDTEEDASGRLYLAKFRGRSYHRCRWFTEAELRGQFGLEVDSKKRGLHARMGKVRRLRLSKEQHFNPMYLVPDRILNSTDLFAAIQPKKANQIKGTWQESLQLVISKMLNFQKNQYPYGTLLLEEPAAQQQNQKDSKYQGHSLPTILNRVYFGLYQDYLSIWKDIGRAISLFIQTHKNEHPDFTIVGHTLREAALFLYLQWHTLSLQRYESLKTKLGTHINLDEDIVPVVLSPEMTLQHKYCLDNIFMTSKMAEQPKNETELQRLNPLRLDCSWLQTKAELPYHYEYLQQEDMRQLDLNVQPDRFYLIKWRQLSYAESSWEKESLFGHPEKIEEFLNINKMPNKDIREGLQNNLKMHRELLSFYDKNRQHLQQGRMRKPPLVELNQERLYLFKPAGAVPKKVYKGKEVITFKNYRLLKEFQNQSLNWLVENWYQNRNCILADEMGLGKTIQIIAFLYHLTMNEKVLGPFLVLAPLTTLQQWRREIEAWTSFNCLLYYDEGQVQGLETCRQHEFNCLYTRRNGQVTKSDIPKFHILLTNYESFIRHFQELREIPFQHIIVDEAHKMKNPRTSLSLCLRAIPCSRATLLTGTPLQNNTRELWSLLNYLHPREFPNEDRFVQEHGSLSSGREVQKLKKVLRPYLLRRVKQDVQKLIPKLSEIIIDVQMTKIQKTVYKGLLQRNKNDIIKGLSTANLNNLAIQFRKCCNHPFLISHQLETSLTQEAQTPEQAFVDSSGKAILLIKLLTKFQEQGKKTLIFSQFVTMLELLQEHLEKTGFRCELLHGGVSASDRTRAISRFCDDKQAQVFLISTKAGGVGINLTAATEIVIYDSDWNPQNDIQATARAHRIGQKQEVTVYRLITNNSYEAEMFRVASRKLGMDKALFSGDFFKQNKESTDIEEHLSKEEVEMLLKKGVLGFIESSQNEEQFFKQDIDQIIEKNGRRVEYSLGRDKNYTYSKSKFVGDQNAAALDIHSENFWQVALKDIQSPIQKLAKKIQGFKQYAEPESQEQLMLQIMGVVSQFVKVRVTGSSFNAEEERTLLSVLSLISSERTINRHYRLIADRLMEEIQKPSRRFKVSAQHILNIRHNLDQIDSAEESEGEAPSEKEEQEAQEEETEPHRLRGKKSKQKMVREARKRESEEQEQTRQSLEIMTLRQDYQKVCFICLKPKCSVFCGGICSRAFHNLCWANYLKEEFHLTEAISLKEMGMKFSTWSGQIRKDQICPECEEGSQTCYCSICGEKGTLDEQAKSDDAMTQCKQRQCSRFYHIQCLSESEVFGWLVELANKRSQGQEGIFLDRLACPVHMCFGCGQRVSKAMWSNLHSCIKCCKTFHPKCLAKGTSFLHLNDSFYLCEQHLSKNDRAALLREYKLINADKKDISELRKTEKMIRQGRNREKNNENEKEKEDSPAEYSYADFDLTPIDVFDFKEYDQLWCRYCGSRFAEKFETGPWGASTLCFHHSKLWRKGKLDLGQYPESPPQPIFRKSTELKYLNRMALLKKLPLPKLLDDLIRRQCRP